MIDFEIAVMTLDDIPNVMKLESVSHSHPWTQKNFEDSIASGYWVYVLKSKSLQKDTEAKGIYIGHAVLMPGVEELHLLNVTVSKDFRRQKVAQRTLKSLEPLAIERDLKQIILEVRVSNVGAIELYKSLGFHEIATRKNYYPAAIGPGREDALMMAKTLID
jgi:ribosomal-protein-alanine N-acetyltransferase